MPMLTPQRCSGMLRLRAVLRSKQELCWLLVLPWSFGPEGLALLVALAWIGVGFFVLTSGLAMYDYFLVAALRRTDGMLCPGCGSAAEKRLCAVCGYVCLDERRPASDLADAHRKLRGALMVTVAWTVGICIVIALAAYRQALVLSVIGPGVLHLTALASLVAFIECSRPRSARRVIGGGKSAAHNPIGD